MRRDIRAFDFTLLVVGSIVGDGIFVVSGLGAQHLVAGAAPRLAARGLFAALIGLAFIQCAAIFPEVGGAFAYTRHAFGRDISVVTGWALYLGDTVALRVPPRVRALPRLLRADQ